MAGEWFPETMPNGEKSENPVRRKLFLSQSTIKRAARGEKKFSIFMAV